MTTYLALGTNLGDRNLNLLYTLRYITQEIGTLSSMSSIYETPPWKFNSIHLFLNMVVRVETNLLPIDLLKKTQKIERQLGRKIKKKYQDRIIDIDIILYDHLVYNSTELIIPHPHYKERDFVLKPLQEVMENDFHINPKFKSINAEIQKTEK